MFANLIVPLTDFVSNKNEGISSCFIGTVLSGNWVISSSNSFNSSSKVLVDGLLLLEVEFSLEASETAVPLIYSLPSSFYLPAFLIKNYQEQNLYHKILEHQ